MQLLGLALICFGLIISTTATTIENCIQTEQFDQNAGIYFENLGKACATNTEWKNIVYFNLDKFINELNMVNDTIQTLKTLFQFQDILDVVELLKSNKQATRNKRAAPLNIIGWVGHELFGIMDAAPRKKWSRKSLTLRIITIFNNNYWLNK